jgi:hypothetical protein
MLIKNKNVFWEAFIMALFVFGTGILLGIFIENSREDKLAKLYANSEIDLLDVQIQSEILNLNVLNCDEAIIKNIEFGDRVYNDAKLLDQYEEASNLKSSLIQQHKKYDLLRTLLWLNSIKIKEKCGNESFHTVVYLYDYQPLALEEKSKQKVFSRFLEDLKSKEGNKILLIPIARNLEISSLDLFINSYDINQTSIIVDERLVITNPAEFIKIKQRVD